MRRSLILLFSLLAMKAWSQCAGSSCSICDINVNIINTDATVITSSTSINSSIAAGNQATAAPLVIEAGGCGIVSIEVEIDFLWDIGSNNNWIHGISFDASGGWSSASGVVPADWIFQNTITGDCSDNTYDSGGFYYDGTDSSSDCDGESGVNNDGNPSNNYGLLCEFDCPTFGFDLEYCPIEAGDAEETISFIFTDDGETGDWNDPQGCIFTINIPIQILSSGVQIPEQFGPICIGESIDIDAGEGCNSYNWSTGDMTNVITVMPTETTIYSVSVGDNGCDLVAEVEVLVEECCEADAGEITATPDVLCPGENTTIQVINQNDDDDYSTSILIVDASGVIIEIIDGTTGVFTHDMCAIFDLYAWNYWENNITLNPQVGDNISTVDCSNDDECCELVNTTVSFEDTEPPIFADTPPDVTLSCIDDNSPMEMLDFTDNCIADGMVDGVEIIDFTPCDGGSITRTWTVSDSCNAQTEYTQTITIDPIPLAIWSDTPADMTVACVDRPTSFPDLTLTNSAMGSCLINEIIPPVVDESGITNCGGTIIITWSYTDLCDRDYELSQTITVEPPPVAVWSETPADMTVICDDRPTSFPELMLTNSAAGDCLIEETITPVIDESGITTCGGQIVVTWSHIDFCDRDYEISQTITVEPPPVAIWSDTPADMTVICEDRPTSFPDLMLTNNATGDCLIEETVTPAVDESGITTCGGQIVVTWSHTDFCDRDYEISQTITVEPPPVPSLDDTPASITLDCGETIPPPAILTASNGAAGDCLLEEMLVAVVTEETDICNRSVTYTWSYNDACGNMLMHAQTITINPPPEAAFTDMPSSITLTCAEIPTMPMNLIVDNGETGDCQIMETIVPTEVGAPDECGGDITYTWSFTDECGRPLEHTQVITIEPAPIGQFVDVPANITVHCGDTAGDPIDLEFTNGEVGVCLISAMVAPTVSGPPNPCGGGVVYTWTYTDDCGRPVTETQTVTYNPAPEAAWIDIPSEINVDCADFSDIPPMLSYTNGANDICNISGSVPGVIIGQANPCGETVMYQWTFTDDCGRTIQAEQNININEAPTPDFVNPPQDMTLGCDVVSEIIPVLTYTNGLSGNCERSGMVAGIQSGSFDECGGIISNTWTVTDECGHPLTYSQVITVEPAPPSAFLELPPDITLDCEEVVPDPQELIYSNDATSLSCLIEGSVSAEVEQSGLVTTYTWTHETDCNPSATITHVQNITESINPVISIDPLSTVICAGNEFDLSTINVTNSTGNIILIEYQDDFGNVLPSSVVQPLESTDYIIAIFNESLCFDFDVFTVNVEKPAVSGTGLLGNLCAGIESISLFEYLNSPYDFNGTWYDISNSNVNINDPNDVNLSQLTGGIYQFEYEVVPGNVCPPVSTIVTIEIFEPSSGQFLEAVCDDAGVTYEVYLLDVSSDVTTDIPSATITTFNDGSVTISGIPITSNITITFTDGLGCSSELTLEPPVCNCPSVPAPSAVSTTPICFGDIVPELSVTVESGLNANWYDDIVGGTPLVTGSLIYTPNINAPGLYIFYVQAFDQNGCPSNTRTPVTIELIDVPTATNAILSGCVDLNGVWIVDLSTLNPQVNSNNSYTYKYYKNLADAEVDNGEILPQTAIVTTDLILFVSVTNPQGCTSIAQAMLSPLPLPSFVVNTTDEQCFGDENGVIAIGNIIPSGTLFDLNSNGFSNTTTYTDLAPGQYVINAQSPDGCESTDTLFIMPGVDLNIEDIVAECSNNGTLTDPNDDIYTISFTVEGADPANIVVTDVNNVAVDLMFNTSFSFTVDADPAISDAVYTVTDNASGCWTTLSTGSLNPCSTDCSFVLSPLVEVCMGNGTPTDPSDDFYTIEIYATAGNNTADSYIILVDGVITTLFDYGQGGQITIPADGQTTTITVQDSEDDQCFISETFSNLNPCSDQCIMDVVDLTQSCDNNETGEIESDDIITITFTIDPTNEPGSAANIFINGQLDAEYNYGELVTLTFMAEAGSTATVVVQDNTDSSCEFLFDVNLNPCSSCEGNVEAGIDEVLTCSITSVFLSGTSDPIAPLTYWTDPNGQIINGDTITVSGTGTYLYNADYGDNCIISDSLEITTDDSVPTAIATSGLIFDCDTDSLMIVGLANGGTGPFEYAWYDENGSLIGSDISVIVYGPGVYELEVYDTATGCSSPRTVSVVEDRISGPVAIIYTDPSDIVDCVIEVIYLSSDEESGTIYNWTINGIPTPADQLSISDAAEVMLVAIDSLTGCENSDSLNIPNLIEYPIIDFSPIDNLDCETDMVTLDASGSQLSDAITITWYNEAGEIISQGMPVLEVTSVGVYVLELIDTNNGCENTDTAYVIDVGDRPEIFLDPMITIPCDQTELELTVDIITNLTDFSTSWTAIGGNILNGQTSTTATVDGPGIYEVTVYNNENGCDQIAQVNVAYPEQISDLDLALADQSCDEVIDGSVEININTGGTAPFTYYLDGTVIEESELDQLSSGTYDLLIIDGNNCEFDTIFSIDVLPPFELTLPPDITLSEGESTTFTIETNLSQSEIESILWSPSAGLNCDSCATVVYDGQKEAEYTVTLTDINGCTAEAMIRVSLDPVSTIFFPNIINPDGTSNPNFYPITADPDAVVDKLLIYDRWGNLMYVNENFMPNIPELGWDGIYKGQKAEQGVYVFYCKFTFGNGSSEAIAGDVTLSR